MFYSDEPVVKVEVKGGLHMNKKRFYITISAISVMCVLGACGNNKTYDAGLDKNVSESENSEVTDTEGETVKQEDIKQEDTGVETIANLTENSNTGVTIDYSINSYQSIQDFSYQLFKENMETQNPVLSPVSAYLALAMAGFGADGNTWTEFYQLLGDSIQPISDDLMNTLPVESENQILSLANSAWIDDQYIVDENWIGSIKSLLDAEAYQTNLSSTDAMNSMNNWIKTKTNNMIDEMVTGPLDYDTRLVLFNTIYFKAKWNNPFDANSTYLDQFEINDDEQIEIDMMHKDSEDFEYVYSDFAEGLIFPYYADAEGHNLALVALKPTEGMNVREMYSKLTSDVVSEMLNSKQTMLVNTKLPKFEISFEENLNDSLMNMGLTDCFDAEKADFSLMGRNENGNNLYISLVKQKAKIIVDEEGTEAAAATEVMMFESCALIEEEAIDVYFDEPFLYMIIDMDKEIPLFIGILDNPA